MIIKISFKENKNPPRKRKQGRPKMTTGKTFEGDFKMIELTQGMAESEAKEKKDGCIILNGQKQKKIVCDPVAI